MGATASHCRTHLYLFEQAAKPSLFTRAGSSALFILHNPSPTNERKEDPAIARCLEYAWQWNIEQVAIAYLFSLRASDPVSVYTHPSPVDPKASIHLSRAATAAEFAVCAWGGKPPAERVQRVLSVLMEAGTPLRCLGVLPNGTPKHVLAVPRHIQPQSFEVPNALI